MRLFFSFLFSCCFCAVVYSAQPSGAVEQLAPDAVPHKIERRAAFDIGSGQIKMQVSDVDLTVNKIVNVLLADTVYVGLREDLVKSLHGPLSPEMQQQTA